MNPLYLNTAPPQEDTFSEEEYADFCAEFAASYLCDPVATAQTLVTGARMARRADWRKEGLRFLENHGLLPEAPALMHLTA